MKDVILLELARRWEEEAKETRLVVADEQLKNARDAGYREGMRACADCLKMLVSIIGEPA